MLAYLIRYHDRILSVLARHLLILVISISISVIIASAITIGLIVAGNRVKAAVLRILGMVYSVPSMAFFSILIPILGIGLRTAVFVLVCYNQFLLVRNFTAGIDSTDQVLIEAAMGMGMSRLRILRTVSIPLALPIILAGIRLAVISTIGIGTIAALINAGGIGDLLFDGLRTMNSVKIFWGVVLSSGLAITANSLLSVVEKWATHLLNRF
ncbi:MAG: ABC transporter permease [Treponema sp.]|jgi:osmoprotectant transport system permease protein|nr:ABC transporter permease [Treponema sp.]